METSTRPALRPLGLGELFDQAIRLYRRNFLIFVGIIALVYIPNLVLQTAAATFLLVIMENMNSSELVFSPAYWLLLLSIMVSGLLYTILVNGVGTAALTHAIARSYLNQKISIIDSYRQLGLSWLYLLFAMLAFSILASLVSFWAIVPIVGWFTGVGAMLFLSGAVEGMLPATTVIEKGTWFTPITRAWNLTRRRFWWLMGVAFIFAIFQLIISTGPALLIQYIVTLVLGSGQNALTLTTLTSSILGGLLQLFTLPILTVMKTLIYFDLRIRTEGFDLALTAFEAPEGTEIDIASIPAPEANEKWLTWDDISKFAIITIGLFGIIALAVGVAALLITIISNIIQ